MSFNHQQYNDRIHRSSLLIRLILKITGIIRNNSIIKSKCVVKDAAVTDSICFSYIFQFDRAARFGLNAIGYLALISLCDDI